MKNKKLLNIYLLVLSLLSLFSFILPFQKFHELSLSAVGVKVSYYITSAFLCIALVLIITISIVNLFTDNYEGIKFNLALSLIAFLMVFINIIVYSVKVGYGLGWGYILVAVFVFALNSFNQGVKVVNSFTDIKKYFCNLTQKLKSKRKPKVKTESKQSSSSNKQRKTIIRRNKSTDTKQQVSDTKVVENAVENAVKEDIVTGEK